MTSSGNQAPVRRRRPRKRVILLAVCLGLLVALALAEVALRLFDPTPSRFSFHAEAGYANASHATFDYRERLVRTGAQGCILSPLNKSDASQPAAAQANPNPIDLLVIGDSFAAGQAAPWPLGCIEVAATKLAEDWPGFRYCNTGTSGYGTDQALIRLREQLHQRPRVVLYLLCDNDLRDNFDYLHFGMTKPRFELQGSQLVQAQRPSSYNRLLLSSRLAAWIARPFIDPATQMIGWKSHSIEQRAALARALIQTMREECRQAGAQLVVVGHWLPLQPEPDPEFALLVRQLTADGQAPLVLNHHIPLDQHYDKERWHWNETGHRLVGAALARHLAKHLEAAPK